MATMEITYRDGLIEEAKLHGISRINLTDCRESEEPFISIDFSNGPHTLVGFMSPAIAEELLTKLQDLFTPKEK